MNIRIVTLLLLTLPCWLTACQRTTETTPEITEEPVTIEQSVATEQTTAAETAESEGIPSSKPDYSPVITEGYQFVEGMGISSPGAAAFYQMDISKPVELKNEYATAQLVNAVYQDNTVSAKILIKDHSVSVLSKEEIQKIREEQPDHGEAVPFDNSYFCIDQEKQMYGRSAFQELQASISKANNGRGQMGLLRGHGIAEVGFAFHGQNVSHHYEEYLEHGYITSSIEMKRQDARFLMKEPEGIYELSIYGFEEPFRFEFHKVPEYKTLDGIPGIEQQDGFYFLTTGRTYHDMNQKTTKKQGKRLHVFCHIYPKDGYDISPFPAKLSVPIQGKETLLEDMRTGRSISLQSDIFSGMPRWGTATYDYDISDTQDLTSATLVCEGMTLVSDEKSETYLLDIPDTEAALDIQVEFSDAVLSLTKVERREEPAVTETDHEDLLKVPTLYLTTSITPKEENRQLWQIMALCSEDSIRDPKTLYYDVSPYAYAHPDVEPGDFMEIRKIFGFIVPYEDGTEQVPIAFFNPRYQWKNTFAFPVITEEMGGGLPE